MKKLLSLLFASLLIIPGCEKLPGMGDGGTNSDALEYVQLHLDYEVDPWLGFEEDSDEAKSFIDAGTLNKITDINVLVFRYERSGLVFDTARSKYFKNEIPRLLLDKTQTYRISFLANCGKNIIEDVRGLGDYEHIKEGLRVEYSNYAEGFKATGMPMIYTTDITSWSDETLQIKFKRLYSRWAVTLDCSELKYSTYQVKGLRILNAPKAIYPLSDHSMIKGVEDACSETEGDCVSEQDIDALNNGGSAYLYILENVQGELLPDNSLSTAKTPQFIRAAGHGDKLDNNQLTSICLNMAADTPWAIYDNVKYQAYLGKNNTSDFSIERNTPHKLTIKLTADKVLHWDWRIEPDEPVKVFDPRIDISFETYRNENNAWMPKIIAKPVDCQQLEALYGDFMKNMQIKLTVSSQHMLFVRFRTLSTWRYYNSLFLANGGKLNTNFTYHESSTEQNGSVRDGYYTSTCTIYPEDFIRSCNYDSELYGKYIFLPGKDDKRWTPSCFESAINPGQCEEYTVYNDFFDYEPDNNRWVWSYSPEDYRNASNDVHIDLDICIDKNILENVKNIYGKSANEFIKTSYDLHNGCPYTDKEMKNLGVDDIRIYIQAIGS